MSSNIEWHIGWRELEEVPVVDVKGQQLEHNLYIGVIVRFPENVTIGKLLTPRIKENEVINWLKEAAAVEKLIGTEALIKAGPPNLIRVNDEMIAALAHAEFKYSKIILCELTAAESIIQNVADHFLKTEIRHEPLSDQVLREHEILTDEGIDLSPEKLNALKDNFLSDYYEQWLDMEIPALQGKTPRQASKSEQGRNELERLFAYMSEQAGDADLGLDIPALRKSLGMTGDY
jgi:hypothetical protein